MLGKQQKQSAAIAATLLVTFVAGSGSVPTGGSAGWPVETYPHACMLVITPQEPFCIDNAYFDGGFKYRDEFAACRQSLQNFAESNRQLCQQGSSTIFTIVWCTVSREFEG